MEYMDITSAHRDRIRFPNQASFELTYQQLRTGIRERQLINPVSCQTIAYPNPQEFPQMAFFEETIVPTYGQIVSTAYLPLMYATETSDTLIELDELVLRSTDPTTRQIISSGLYPRNAVPLGENDEFYTGQLLEDVLYGETRTILFYRFDDTNEEAVFQSGEVLNISFVGTQYSVYTSVQSLDLALSNIDRFYQGKYLKMQSGSAAGQSRLIIDYIPGHTQNQFILDSRFSRNPSAGDTFSIVSDRKYFATIDRPFSNPLSSYPAYRIPTPQGIVWNQQILASFDYPIGFLSLTNQTTGTGVALALDIGATDGASNPLANLVYMSSTDNAATSWNTPITVFENIYLQEISTLIWSTALNSTLYYFQVPYIFYALPQASTPDPANANPLFVRATYSFSEDGQGGWPSNGGQDVDNVNTTQALTPAPPAPYTGLTINSYRQSIGGGFAPLVGFVLYNGATQPELYFEYQFTVPPYSANLINTGLAGEIIHLYSLGVVAGNPVMYYLDHDTATYLRSTNSTGSTMAAGTPYVVNVATYDPTYPTETYALDLPLEILRVNGLDVPVCLSVSGTAGVETLWLNVSPTIDGEVTPWQNAEVWNELNTVYGLRVARIWQGTYRGQFTTAIIGARDGVGLQISVCFDDPFLYTSSFTYPEILDTNEVLDFDLVTNNDGTLTLVYGRNLVGGGSELVSLNVNNLEIGLARPYRIRTESAAFASGGVGTIVSATDTTITLPASLQAPNVLAYKGQYIHVYSPSIYTLPNPFGMFNDFCYISDYDPATNTLTLGSKLSYNPDPYAIAGIGSSIVYLPTLSDSSLGTDESGNGYNFTILVDSQYAVTYTDSTSVTLDNLLYADGSANVGLQRIVTNDTGFTEVYEAFAQTPGVYGSPYSTSISFWVLFNSLASVQTLLHMENNVITTGYKFFYDFGGTNNLEISRGAITFASIPVIVDRWYNITFVQDPREGIFIYVNNTLFGTSTDLGESLYVQTVTVANNDTLTEPLDGYMKNVVISGSAWSDQVVENVYYAGLGNTSYALAFEILTCLTDSYNPLDYSGTLVHNQNAVCYQVELTHLTLPNVLLKTGFGNRIAFYPYIYVVLESLDHHTTAKLYSNNPVVARERVVFKVPIRDTSTPDRAYFVNNFSGMSVIMKFKPSDTFRFQVLMYNGELLETSQADNIPPLEPNPLLQISATLGFKRVEPPQ